MKRYRFRLEQVARVRRIQEEQARNELHMARRRLLDAGTEAAHRAERLEHRSSQSGVLTASSFLAQRFEHQGLAQALLAARSAEANAALLLDSRIEEWMEAARQVSTLERLESRSRTAHQVEVDHEEQKELDDLITTRANQAKEDKT